MPQKLKNNRKFEMADEKLHDKKLFHFIENVNCILLYIGYTIADTLSWIYHEKIIEQ